MEGRAASANNEDSEILGSLGDTESSGSYHVIFPCSNIQTLTYSQ